MDRERVAPAKVNLFLHVGPLGADGFHPLRSLMVFADIGDRVRLSAAERMEFRVEGPYGAGLDGPDNLVVKARDAWLAQRGGAKTPHRLTLDKRLPVAAGLGGGSSDAAATLRLLDEAFPPALGGAALQGIALTLGSDTPACLEGAPVMASGHGQTIEPPPPFPPLDAVLVNPSAPCPTAAVYRAYDRLGLEGDIGPLAWPSTVVTPRRFADYLAGRRNDLEAAAQVVQPKIAEVLSALRRDPGALLVRMSGSGATCFALCDDRAAAEAMAGRLAAAHPTWWVRPCRLAN